MQRSFLGQVMTSRAVPQCRGFGTVIPRSVPRCAGRRPGAHRAATLTVNIPPGVGHGMRIQLAGEGEVGPGGGPPGDLYVEVDEEPHPLFTRRGDDLHCTVHASDDGGGAGPPLPLRPSTGPRSSTSARAPRPATVSRSAGQGHAAAAGASTGSGDLMVHVDVETPTKLDARAGASCCGELAALRGEERPACASHAAASHGLFSRLRDSFR